MRFLLPVLLLTGCTGWNPTYDPYLAALCDRTGNCRPDLMGYTNDAGSTDLATAADLLPTPDLIGLTGSQCTADDDCLRDPRGRPVKCGPVDPLDNLRHCCVQLTNWICDDRDR